MNTAEGAAIRVSIYDETVTYIALAVEGNREVVFKKLYADALTRIAPDPAAYIGREPAYLRRGQNQNSAHNTSLPSLEAINRLVMDHPRFSLLKRVVDTHSKYIFGKKDLEERIAQMTPECYLRDTATKTKSAGQRTRDQHQLTIFRDTGIPRVMFDKYAARGHRVDWHQVAVDRAIIQCRVLPMSVLDDFHPVK